MPELFELDVEVPPPKLDELELVEELDEELLEELELVDELVETPLEVEVELPPVEVEVELPPLDVEVETPLDVDTLPVEVDTVPELVEAVMMTLPPLELDPPKKPPEKKPPPKPKPPPPLPPTTTRPLLPLLPTIGGGGGGTNGTAGVMVRVTVRVVAPAPAPAPAPALPRTPPVATQAVRRTVRRTTRRELDPAVRTCAVRTFVCLTIAGRGGGFSATCTAPPPMMAPPQVQAQSFAKAILTDISAPYLLASAASEELLALSVCPLGYWTADANDWFKRKRVNHDLPLERPFQPLCRNLRPIRGQRY